LFREEKTGKILIINQPFVLHNELNLDGKNVKYIRIVIRMVLVNVKNKVHPVPQNMTVQRQLEDRL